MKLLQKMKIRQKLTLLLLFIGLIPTLVVSTIAYITISTQLTSKTTDQLSSIAVKQEQKINALLQGKQEEALKLANRYDLQLAVGEYLGGTTKTASAITAVLRNRKTEGSGIQAMYLSNPNDVIIAGTVASDTGQKLSTKDYYTKAGQKNSIAVREDPKDGIDKLYVATRFTVNQKDVGVLTIIYGIDDFVAAIQDYTGLGTTGETLIAGKDDTGKVVSLFPLRFDADASLIANLTALQLFEHTDSTYSEVKDYRDHGVMISARTIGFADWVIATKIDTNEAFAPIDQLRNTLAGIVVASSIAIILIALYFTRFFTAPIITLTEKTRNIMQGDFNQRIAVNSSDEVGALATAFNDMTTSLQNSTRKLGEEHARLQASIDSLDIGFLMTTKSGRVVSSNPALLQIFDINTKAEMSLEIAQKRLDNFDLIKAIDTCLNTGKPFTADEVGYGSRFLSIMGAPIRLEHGEVIGAVMVAEDITEAKILARSKDEFFSIASHELRTPLTAIRGNTRMILDYYAELLTDPSVKEMITDIHGSSVRLIDIVNDFLDISRIEQDKIMFKNEAFSMEKIIDSVIYEMRPVLEEKKLSINFDKGSLANVPAVWADADRAKQIVYNLVGNAAKFTEHGGITVGVVPDPKVLKITVTDTGHGIPMDKRELLFRKFQQAGDSLLTRDTAKGTGLGLYISKMLIERMGGTIRLEQTKEGQGTTFSFTLPLATPDQQAATKAEAEAKLAPSIPATTTPAASSAAPTTAAAPTAPATTPAPAAPAQTSAPTATKAIKVKLAKSAKAPKASKPVKSND